MFKVCLFSYKQHILQLCLFKICLTICFSTYMSQFTLTVITDNFRLKSTHWLYAIFSITTVPFPLIFNLLSFIKKKKNQWKSLFLSIFYVFWQKQSVPPRQLRHRALPTSTKKNLSRCPSANSPPALHAESHWAASYPYRFAFTRIYLTFFWAIFY